MPGLKAFARARLPERLVTTISAIRARRHSHALNERWHVCALSERLTGQIGFRVQGGPFAGLMLPRAAMREHLAPYLLGTYEHEIQHVWTDLNARDIPLVVNIGAKFGYYAVGLATLLNAPVVAFDPDPWARRVTKQTAQLNRIETVTVRSLVTRAWLAARAAGTLVVIDCDGCEVPLLAAPLPAGLAACTLVVEIHENASCGSGSALARMLAATHDLENVATDATPQASPIDLGFLGADERALAVKELRPVQSWLVARPR